MTLQITQPQRDQIAELIAVASANPFDVHVVKEIVERDINAFRDMMRVMSIELPLGLSVTYTHEIQPHAPPPGLCHHISISMKHPGVMPSLPAVEMILEEFGMLPIAQSDGVWVEDVTDTHKAVNVVQLIRVPGGDACVMASG